MRIHLLQTNDVHSQMENYMRLGTKLRAQREAIRQQGDVVLTFDIGDVLDRVRPETEATLGELNAAMMAVLDYDAWVFGNNEGLTIPVSHWDQLRRLSRTTVMGSNLRTIHDTPFEGFKDYKIYQFGGLKLGVFGVTPAYDKPYELLDVEVSDPFTAAERQVSQLRELGCNVIVALSHLGLWDDRKLAQQVKGLDVILGGHSHQFMKEAEWVNGVAIFQPGKHALTYGHTVVDFDEQRGVVAAVSSEPVLVDLHGTMDPNMAAVYEAYSPVIEDRLSAPVVRLDQRLPVQMNVESSLANILVDGLIDRYPCDLAMMMAGALNASLCEGEIQWRHVHGACSTPTRPVLLTLSGADIHSILEKSLRPEYFNQRGFGFGFRGAVIGFMAVANAEVDFSVINRQPVIEAIRVGGTKLQRDRQYRVVTCEYLWLSPVYEEFRNSQDVHVQVPLVREVLREALSKQEVLANAKPHHYHLLAP